jgi:membrane protein DedA with SNARE-associated domain
MTDWIIGFIERFGYAGIALLMALENIFPPIPSELIMPFAGYVAATGHLHPAGVIAAGTAGSLLGTLPWYWLGRAVGRDRLRRLVERHGRWLAMSPEDLQRADEWFKRHGARAVLVGRIIPALRSVVSMPAGVAHMPFASFLFWSGIGTAVWTAALASLGYVMERDYERAEPFLNAASKIVVAVLVLTYIWRVARFGKHGPNRRA